MKVAGRAIIHTNIPGWRELLAFDVSYSPETEHYTFVTNHIGSNKIIMVGRERVSVIEVVK